MTRIIHYSNKSGSQEGIYFTEDTELDVKDVIPFECDLVEDFIMDDDLPSSFPTDRNLEVVH